MKKAILTLILTAILIPAFSQDADAMTELLSKKSATLIDLSYLVASELGMEVTPFEAYTYCDRFGSFGFTEPAGTPLTAKAVSNFLMMNYGLSGGILWSTFKSPRYAWKELKNAGFWKKGMDPDTVLSGRDIVVAMSKFFSMYPKARMINPPSSEASDRYRKALLSAKENDE